MAKQKIYEAKLTISREMTIPQHEQGGVDLELRANGGLLGRVTFSGAYVHFQNAYVHFQKGADEQGLEFLGVCSTSPQGVIRLERGGTSFKPRVGARTF
jgi:hypothetical protein